MNFSDWSVYHVANCRHSNPRKDKFVLIFNINSGLYGFFINSEIHEFILKREKLLLPCIADISFKTNGFLTHDSFIDCQKLFRYEKSELNDSRGEVCDQTKNNVINAITACPVLDLKYKMQILKKYGSLGYL